MKLEEERKIVLLIIEILIDCLLSRYILVGKIQWNKTRPKEKGVQYFLVQVLRACSSLQGKIISYL